METHTKNIFQDIRILDLTRLLPGGFCTQMWGDLGAEVIKIEEREKGDYCRWDPPFIKGESYYFLALNRNKKSMTINLKTTDGKQVFRELVKTADVVIENFRPGVMDRLGLGFPVLKKIHPGLVYCAISGYGQGGPHSQKAGHDINFLADTGYLDIAVKGCGGLPGVFISDMAGSMYASFAISLALLNRQKTGFGQFIDISIMDSFFSWLTLWISKYGALKRELDFDDLDYQGARLSYNLFRTADDQFVAIGMVEKKFWVDFCQSLGLEDLIEKQTVGRKEDPLAFARLEKLFLEKTKREWEEWAKDRDICFSPVRSLGEALSGPGSPVGKLVFKMNIPDIGKVFQTSMPLGSVSEKTIDSHSPPPFLGQHTEEILASIGMEKDYIELLKKNGSI